MKACFNISPWVVGQGFPRDHQNDTIVIALVCLLELTDKVLLLETPHTFVMGHGKTKLVLNKASLLAGFDSDMQAFGGKSHCLTHIWTLNYNNK